MDRVVYEGLVGRLEAVAAHSPAAFRSKVLLISCVAYMVLFAALASVVALLYFGIAWARTERSAVMIKLALFALPVIPVFYTVLRMFFMRLQPPQGRPLTREQAPRLFEVLDKMRRKLRGPAFHHVLIDDSYNAAVSQRPRWGFFGGHTNYLVLGLPYLLGVPANEMLATIAHEYGHLCGNHGKLSAWVYRQRRTFGALYGQVLENRDTSWVHGLLAGGLDRFMPYYNAYTFVLSRQNEYDADRTATELVGAQVNASGLTRDALLGRWLHETFWPTIYRQADGAAQPRIFPYASMRTAIRAGHPEWSTSERLREAWQQQSGLHDTHPSLRDRVEAIGTPATLPAAAESTAAEALLGASFSRQLIAEFDQAWWTRERKEWESRHRHVTRSMARLRELAPHSLQALALHDLQELALLKAEFDSPQAAKPVLEHLLKQPGGPFPKAAYFYGRILLDENNDRGLHYLEQAAADRSLIESAANIGYYYELDKRGDGAAQAWWERIVAPERETA